jgi:hypothetical protein
MDMFMSRTFFFSPRVEIQELGVMSSIGGLRSNERS